jgi:S-adenosylmethionine decarboxylase
MELWGCNDRINDPDAVARAITEAVDAVGATILNLHVHTFSPQGVTGLAVLAESHLSVHSWPEYGYLAADVFTCGTRVEPQAAVPVLTEYFSPEHIDVTEVSRGIPPADIARRLEERQAAGAGATTSH